MSTFDFVLKISDGTTTVTLTSTPFSIAAYHPRTADPDEEPVLAESISVRIRDGSAANNLDELRALARLLKQAKDAQTNRDLTRVYLVWKQSASADEWRTELVRARGEWGEDFLSLVRWVSNSQRAVIDFERRNWWEGPEAQIPLTNGNGTDDTTGLTVVNHDDAGAGHDNYVQIAAASVAGDLPGATRLEVVNTTADSGLGLYHLWVGHNFTDPANFVHILESEDATPTGSEVSEAAASGGEYTSHTITSGTSENAVRQWAISAAQASAAAGRRFKALLRFHQNPNTAVRYRLELRYNASILWQGPLATLNPGYATSIRDLATLRIPAWLEGLAGLEAIDLVLLATQATGSSIDIKPDYLQLAPVDGFRRLEAIGYYLPATWRIVDDGIANRLYADDGAGAQKIGLFNGFGRPVMLEPNKLQRLYFLQGASSGATAGDDTAITRTLSVKLFYRPRRLSL